MTDSEPQVTILPENSLAYQKLSSVRADNAQIIRELAQRFGIVLSPPDVALTRIAAIAEALASPDELPEEPADDMRLDRYVFECLAQVMDATFPPDTPAGQGRQIAAEQRFEDMLAKVLAATRKEAVKQVLGAGGSLSESQIAAMAAEAEQVAPGKLIVGK